ncbi:MAG: SAF domain-containing protein [Acidimicrobiales bacterium]
MIVPGDLREVELSRGPGLAVVEASRRSEMVGRRTAVALLPGSLLNEAQFANRQELEPGHVVAAVALKAGQYPPEMATGDQVLIVAIGASADGVIAPSSAGGTVLGEAARVSGIRLGSGPGGQAAVVSLVVERAVATDLVAAAGADRVGLVLDGGN